MIGDHTLQAKTGRWYDFESDTKGGALDLVMRETGLDQPAAFEWLRSRGLVDATERRIPASAATNPNARGPSERAGDRQPVRRNTADYGRHLWGSSQAIPTDPGHPGPPLAGPPQPLAARPAPSRRRALVARLRPQAHRRGRARGRCRPAPPRGWPRGPTRPSPPPCSS